MKIFFYGNAVTIIIKIFLLFLFLFFIKIFFYGNAVTIIIIIIMRTAANMTTPTFR